MTPQQLFVPRVLCLSLTTSALMLAYVGYTVLGGKSVDAFDASRLLPSASSDNAFFGFAIGAAALSVAWTGVAALVVGRGAQERPLLQRAFAPFILGVALADACAVLGVVAVSSGASPPERAAELGILAALVIVAAHFPTEARLMRLVSRDG